MLLRLVRVTFCGLFLLYGSAAVAYASGYSFFASGADYCGIGGFHAGGGGGGVNADGSPNYYWTFNLSPSLPSGGSLSYSWDLQDAQGVIASGSYDSTTNTSTGGSGASGADFFASRAETGSLDGMAFEVSGYFYCPNCGYGGTQCSESFYESTFTTSTSGGNFRWNP
jgi:hypothetical protein